MATITNGKYAVKITKDATGSFFALLTCEGGCVPGVRGKHYATLAKAKAGAALMLKKV